jgi:hypothetical protein
MGKLMSVIVAICMVACATPQKIEPEILSTVVVQQPEVLEEPDRYLVRINFVVFQQEVAKYPNTYVAFGNALDEWVANLPIECAFFMEEPGFFPFMPFGPSMISDQRGIVRVHFADIEAPPYNKPKGILGYWDWTNNELVLNSLVLEMDADRAYMVALHELGHVFGLSHFLNPGDMGGVTGDYVIPDTFDARRLVMFPVSSDINKCSKLTKLEIALAQKNLPGLQTLGRTSCFHLTEH